MTQSDPPGQVSDPGPVTIGGYKVHSSALTAVSSAPNSTQPWSALTAAQHAVASANDSAAARTKDDTDEESLWIVEMCSKGLPLVLMGVIVYIYYVYSFRVCIDYILNVRHNATQAGIYLGVLNTLALLFFVSYIRTIFRSPGSPLKPPRRDPTPRRPPTTTAYHPQRMPPLPPSQTVRAPAEEQTSETAPLLESTRPSYQATSTALSSRRDNVSVRMDEDHALQKETNEWPVATLSISKRDGRTRWCDICQVVKPDRCHHCSECDKCVLRMDHHCPWVNGCIGYDNHKFFYLFILYASMLSVWVVATMMPLLYETIRDCEREPSLGGDDESRGWTNWISQNQCSFDAQWAVMTIASFLLALLIVSFTVAHTIYILENRTTIESLQDVRSSYIRVQYADQAPPPDFSTLTLPNIVMSGLRFYVVMIEQGEHLWDRGSWFANWKSVMGNSWWLWFVPFGNTPGDGIHDVYNERLYRRLVSIDQGCLDDDAPRPVESC